MVVIILSSSTSIFQILKIIDVKYENQNREYKNFFDLEKLKISNHRLTLLLENLLNDGYINGITFSGNLHGDVHYFLANPRLTTKGLLFLEENTFMKRAYKTLKEAKEWIPSLSDFI